MIGHETAQPNPSTHAGTLTIAHLIADNENLRRKLETQPVIEQAKGILMVCHGVSADDAFDLLRRWSQDSNTKLHQVAQAIVDGRRGDPVGWRMPHRGPARPQYQYEELSPASVSEGCPVMCVDSTPALAPPSTSADDGGGRGSVRGPSR